MARICLLSAIAKILAATEKSLLLMYSPQSAALIDVSRALTIWIRRWFSARCRFTAGIADSSADSALLSWQGGGFTYAMSYSGLRLSQADMIRIAESLR